jgi:type IV secretory pathway TraG/TraD family ATPase VirD4
MATHWGRKESIIWPPHVPIMSYTAIAGALLCTLFFLWQHLNFSMTPLQQSYITEYVRSQVGGQFKAHQSYRLIYVAGGKREPRLALPVDIVKGSSTLPNGTTVPVGLSDLAQSQGYTFVHRGLEQKLTDASLHRWLRFAIYDGKGMLDLFSVSLIEGAICFAVMLWFAIPADMKRFRVLKYGRVLRGPEMMTPKEFNAAQAAKTRAGFLPAWALRLFENPARTVEGIGFKTTEMKEMMRVPPGKEAQHFQMMGDTGAGKTQLIMQILRQIRDRGDVAIVYDPACEFVQRFYDEKRGDFILNPLDARCPYWSPSSEMARNQEAAAIAASLYQPTSSSGKDEFFYRTPSKIFAHLLKQGPDPHTLAEWMADEPKLQQMVKGTEMAFFIDRKAGPQAAGVLASLGLVAESFRMLPRKENTSRTWNALDWSEKRKGWIFITSQLNEREILRPLVSLWIDTLIMRLLAVPKPGQKQAWFVIDELASLQKLPQLHTAITESRKSKNPIVLGFQGKAQLEDIYGRLAEVMLSQPATKVFMKTTEPRAAEWISETIGKVEIERLKETKFDGSRSGKNFTIDRQVESLVMASEISGLDDRHAYLKLGNNVARFDFDYIDLLGETEAFIPRVSEDDELQFARTRMGTVDPTPETPEVLDEEDEELDTEEEEFDEEGEHFTRPDDSPDDPLSGPLQQEIPQKRSPIPWPGEQTAEVARAGERNRPMPTPGTDQNEESVAIAMHPEKSGQQIDLGF